MARAQAAGEALCVDFRAALMDMAGQMLQRRRVELSWSDFASWSLAPETLRLIRRLTRHEDLLQVRGSSTDLRLAFRHDPMRDWLFVEVASSMDTADTLPDEILHEPFFAEVLGAVVVRRSVPARLLDRVRRLNPLALFQALRVCPQGSGTERARIVLAIEDWLAVQANLGPAYRYLRVEALAALLSTDGPEVPSLVGRFPDRTAFGQLARLRNGDPSGGIEFCLSLSLSSEPGVLLV